jgi:signal transduction histidine kinase
VKKDYLLRKIYYLSYAPAFIFIYFRYNSNLIVETIKPSYWGFNYVYGILYGPFVVYIVSYVFIGILSCFWFYLKTKSKKDKRYSRLIITGISIPFIGGILTQIVMPFLGIEIIPLTTILMTFTAFIYAYSIVKYGLMQPMSFSIRKKISVVFLSIFIIMSLVMLFLQMSIINDIFIIPIFAILLSFAALFSILVSKSISKPIIKLRDVAIEIGKGNLEKKIEVESRDEIGELASAFRDMTENLKNSREQIEKHAKELEQNVQKRTRDLDDKVGELSDTKTAVLNMMEDMDDANKELVRTQEELEKSLAELKETDIKKDQFISIAAHELKTPLTSIHGFSQLLQNRKVANSFTKRNKYLKIMDHETKRLSKLVGDILDLSRIDLGTVKTNIIDVNLNEMMDDISKEMDIQIKDKKLKSEYMIEKNLPVISTDREKLVEIVLNLINNSVKYTPEGKITVSVSRENSNIHFIVKDTGFGISKENYEKIFDRFYQVDSSYTRKAGGTGLGLSLCKEFVEILGGKIWLKSKLGVGTEFHFTLPVSGSRDVSDRKSRAEETIKMAKKAQKSIKKIGFGSAK